MWNCAILRILRALLKFWISPLHTIFWTTSSHQASTCGRLRRLCFQPVLGAIANLFTTHVYTTNEPPLPWITVREVSSQPAENPRQLGDAATAAPTVPFTLHLTLTWLSGWWYTFVWVVCLVGYIQNVLFPLVPTRSYFSSLRLAAFYFSSLRLHSCWPRPPLVNIDRRSTDGRKHAYRSQSQLQLQTFPTHQALPFHVTSYVREEIPTRLELETHINAIYI